MSKFYDHLFTFLFEIDSKSDEREQLLLYREMTKFAALLYLFVMISLIITSTVDFIHETLSVGTILLLFVDLAGNLYITHRLKALSLNQYHTYSEHEYQTVLKKLKIRLVGEIIVYGLFFFILFYVVIPYFRNHHVDITFGNVIYFIFIISLVYFSRVGRIKDKIIQDYLYG